MDQNGNLIGKDSIFNLHINKEIWDDVVEYKDEYAQVLNARDMHRISFAHRSPDIHYRAFLIKHLKDVVAMMKLTHCTLHLAVYVMDIFMDNHSVATDRVLLVGNCCLLLAAKVEEYNVKVPKIIELNSILPYPYTVTEYKILEAYMLKYFDWNIMFPTAAHYVHYYLTAAVTQDDLNLKQQSCATIIRDLHLTIRVYLDKVLDDVHYMQKHKPSHLSASIIAIARQANKMSEWHEQLEQFTQYTLSDIEYTKIMLLQILPLPCIDCGVRTITITPTSTEI